MSIEQVDRSYFPFIKDKTKQLKPGDKGPLTLFGGIEVVSDDTIRIKGNKWLLLFGKGRVLKGEEINKEDLVDSLHWFPPRWIGYKYKSNDKK